MSAAILDRARAFALTAEFMTEEKRREVADAIGDKLLAEAGGAKQPPSRPAAHSQAVEIPKDFDVTTFLVDKGVEGADLVRKTAEIVTWLHTTAYAHLTRDARILTCGSLGRAGVA